MNDIEKLARRICWLEFPTKQKGTTEAAYWRGVHPDLKAEYIADARWWAWMTDLLVASKNGSAIQQDARVELRAKAKPKKQ